MKKIYIIAGFIAISNTMAAQNVGIGTTSPLSKLHIKGTVDFSQFIIDAHSTQGNANPLIKLRKSDGTDLMWIHSDDPSNVYIGLDAGRINNASGGFGIVNTFLGSTSGYSNTTGYENTGTGYGSLYSNSTGYQNTAHGKGALYMNTTGFKNTAVGRNALFSNTAGINNTAFGDAALLLSTGGSNNTAYGTSALYNNATASDNTAIGFQVLFSNTTGYLNTAIGNLALYTNTTGNQNTASGYQALYSNTTGNSNTAYGTASLTNNINGGGNSAVGDQALKDNSTGNGNTAIGVQALFANTTGHDNVALGSYALGFNQSGNYNTALGSNAGPKAGAFSNTICIGRDAEATENNQVVLGTTDNSSLVCYAAFNGTSGAAANLIVTSTGQILRSVSSRRYKKDILPLEINTANIYQLRPVSYNSYTDNIRHFGLIAEEVADVIPELATYSREKDVIKGSTDDKLIPDAVQYPLLSVLLLNEVQKHEQILAAQQKQIGKQQAIIEEQNKRIEMLLKEIQKINDKLK